MKAAESLAFALALEAKGARRAVIDLALEMACIAESRSL